ncbi:hypothetical protein [Campylobacter sp. US33a]|uniref:hypothetical protein n=1 Tax=Campylobacter sp. US33a TaxID=2498120 RepID=UPI001067C157|nr:hypothetical protein [Campylobacter sp. US33a]TEY04048.1 hypothetical protein ELQ16_02070 [Campylobacter sp. US33a]
MIKKIVDGGRVRVFDTKNTRAVKISKSENEISNVTLINFEARENNFKFRCFKKHQDEVYKFFTENTKDNLMEIENSEVKFSYQEKLLLKE